MLNIQKKLVVLSGAGISAESGLKTFRDSDGLWEGHRVEDVATPQAFAQDPQIVLDFYNMRRHQVRQAKPNAAHEEITHLQKYFEVHVVTQNIDDLHERASNKNVLHLHGEIFKMRSVKNPDKNYPIHNEIHLGDLAEDGGQLRPDIVWFGEVVKQLQVAAEIISQADYLIIVGTSLVVYPAAGLVHAAKSNCKIFVVDKKQPLFGWSGDVTFIENTAGAGMKTITQLLLES